MDTSRRITIRNLVFFTVAVLAIGWIGRRLDVLMGNPATEGLGILLWLVVPTGVALMLRAFAGDGWTSFGVKPNIKGNAVWYLVALLIYPVLTAIVLAIGGGTNLITFPGFSISTVGVVLQMFALGAPLQFVKNIFEESAWRGYLAPKVYSLGLNDYVGHVLVGLVWGAWHIPYYLFFLDREILQEFTTLSVAVFIPLSIVVMIAWAIVYGEIRLLTGSIWPAVLMHMVEDAFVNQLFTEKHISIVPGTDWLVSPVNGVVSILLFVAVGIGLNRHRKARR